MKYNARGRKNRARRFARSAGTERVAADAIAP
jgi:hypothetical protein